IDCNPSLFRLLLLSRASIVIIGIMQSSRKHRQYLAVYTIFLFHKLECTALYILQMFEKIGSINAQRRFPRQPIQMSPNTMTHAERMRCSIIVEYDAGCSSKPDLISCLKSITART